MAPFDAVCCGSPNLAYVDNRRVTEKPQKGTHVDSISYYTYDLSETNNAMCTLQGRKAEIAFEGTHHTAADNWFTKLVLSAYEMANEIMVESAEDNALRTSYTPLGETGVSIPQAELMDERTIYGTLQGARSSDSLHRPSLGRSVSESRSTTNLIDNGDADSVSTGGSTASKKQEILVS